MLKPFKNREESGDEHIDELLSAYLDGMLELDQRRLLETRLQRDRELLIRLDGLRQTKKAFAQLPHVAVPRNFILSPSMVAPPKRAPSRQQRRTWPAFGWATAAVTLLFLLVFAGDYFVVAPSQRAEGTQIADRAATASGADELPYMSETASLEVEVTLEVEREEKTALEAETQVGATEQELPAEAPQPLVEAEQPPPAAAQKETLGVEPATPLAEAAEEAPAADEGEMVLRAATVVTEEGATVPAEEALRVPGTSTPGPAATPAPEPTEAVSGATAAATAQPVEEIPPSASLTAEPQASEADVGTPSSPEQTSTPEAVAVLMVTPEPADGLPRTQEVRKWLRVAQFGLGTAVIGLAIATLVVRRRES